MDELAAGDNRRQSGSGGPVGGTRGGGPGAGK